MGPLSPPVVGTRIPNAYWSLQKEKLFETLNSGPDGLAESTASQRVAKILAGTRHAKSSFRKALENFLAQFRSPITLILILASGLSFSLRNPIDGSILLLIVLVSALLGFWQEHGASRAVEALMALVEVRITVLREGRSQDIPARAVAPGDILVLSAGDSLPADGIVLESKDLHLSESTLTGETFPVPKRPGILPESTALAHRENCVYQGTHVVSGSGLALTVLTGDETELGKLARRVRTRPPRTEFETGLYRFGFFLSQVIVGLALFVFLAHIHNNRPWLDSFLFALALAVGMTPQMLPAILQVTLAQGAKRMAKNGVVVKRLNAIESFGSMDVLCSDKTGTLTEGNIHLQAALDPQGESSERVLRLAVINATFETGFRNPVDAAIRSSAGSALAGVEKLDEIPYDFIRKRLSILARIPGVETVLITKGALSQVLEACSSIEGQTGSVEVHLEALHERGREFARSGQRVLGLACKRIENRNTVAIADENEMVFCGFLTFNDPPKPGAAEAVQRLRDIGVSIKIVSGDSREATAHLGSILGLENPRVLAGPELHYLTDEALVARVVATDLFAEVEPNQKEHIILALRKAGHVVGFMGDGINDAAALHASDVGISVDGAADVAKEAADIVLLRPGLEVLEQGVREGRVTFANTMKYVHLVVSSNFGNVLSMTAASLFLPFLPLLPKQLLLNNLLANLPSMALAGDRVDEKWIQSPQRWNLKSLRNFMLAYGPLSSVFDLATFGVLLFALRAEAAEFQSGWFFESALSQAAVVMVLRTRLPTWKSPPGKLLVLSTLAIPPIALFALYGPWNHALGFTPLSGTFIIATLAIVLLYLIAAEAVKRSFPTAFS